MLRLRTKLKLKPSSTHACGVRGAPTFINSDVTYLSIIPYHVLIAIPRDSSHPCIAATKYIG